MSVTICPSCLGRSYEAGRCGKCGFAGGEYKPEKTALPIGSHIGSYRIGMMKSASRQSQVYTAVHGETSVPVIIEEFFPARIAGRTANKEEIDLLSDDPELIRRFEQGCLLLEASNQKRPLKRIDTVRANRTIYSVFEPSATMPVSSQCEMMADNPYYFRDENGTPLMTINTLPIPPMPSEREFNPEQYQRPSPVTRPQDSADGFRSQLISEAVNTKGRKRTIAVISGIAAALVLLIGAGVATDPFHIIHPLPSPSPVITETPVSTPEPTAEPTAEPTPEPTQSYQDELNQEEFAGRLLILPAIGKELKGIQVDNDDDQLHPADGAEEETIRGEVTVQIKNGEVLRAVPEGEVKKFFFVVQQNEAYYRIEAGSLSSDMVFKPNPDLRGLGFRLWKPFGESEPDDIMLFDADEEKGKTTWLEAIYAAPEVKEEYIGDKFVAWKDGKVSLRERLPDEGENSSSSNVYSVVAKSDQQETPAEHVKNGPELVITSTEGNELTFALRKSSALNRDELISCLRVVGEDGEELETRKMKKDYKNIDNADFREGGLHYPASSDVGVILCEDTNNNTSLIAEAKKDKNNRRILYVLLHDEIEQINCRVRVGEIISENGEDTYVPWSDRPAEMMLRLWDLKDGTMMSFGNGENDNWLDAVMRDNSFNEVIGWQNVRFSLHPVPQSEDCELIAEDSVGNQRVWTLYAGENGTEGKENNGATPETTADEPEETDPSEIPPEDSSAPDANPDETDISETEDQNELNPDDFRIIERAAMREDKTPVIFIRTTDIVQNVTIQQKTGEDSWGEKISLTHRPSPRRTPDDEMLTKWTYDNSEKTMEPGEFRFSYFDKAGNELFHDDINIQPENDSNG